ncbi:hypothetical protein AGMMS50262_01260 [Bacteroidia bacterium]|nr:hypothetical protein AGMMS50262_01260 [Bacteroidia bacterium]
MKLHSFILFVFALAYLSSCTNRPLNVLSDSKMEAVLYDMYIAEQEIKNNSAVFYNDSVRRQKLLQSVFEKHRISEAAFDTSLVWYNAHLEKYIKINNRISQKYDAELTQLNKENEQLIAQFTVIDTIVLYRSPAFFLQSALRENLHDFCTDTAALLGLKQFDVQCLVLGVCDTVPPVLTFYIESKDSTFVHLDTIRNDGLYSAQYSVPARFRVESIYGNIHFPAQKQHSVFVGNFTVSNQKTTVLPQGRPR